MAKRQRRRRFSLFWRKRAAQQLRRFIIEPLEPTALSAADMPYATLPTLFRQAKQWLDRMMNSIACGGYPQRLRFARQFLAERLESRCLLASDWQNPLFRLDVDDDGYISPLDALVVVNRINAETGLPQSDRLDFKKAVGDNDYLDTDGDQLLSPLDVLAVINALNDTTPRASLDVGLTNDSGKSAVDRITNDGHVKIALPTTTSSVTGARARFARGPIVTLPSDGAGGFIFDSGLAGNVADGSLIAKIAIEMVDQNFGLSHFQFTLDTVAPSIVPPRILAADDSGRSSSDNITNKNSPHAVTATEIGTNLLFKVDSIVLYDAVVTQEVSVATPPLAEGVHQLTAIAIDTAGNSTTVSRPLIFDTTAPSAPTLKLALSSDTGDIGDKITSAGRVTLTGSTEANSFISIRTSSASVRSDGIGEFRIPNLQFAVGTNLILLDVVDLAGNANNSQETFSRIVAAQSPDPVLGWNQAILDAIQLDATPPPVATRGMAMMSIAMLDVVNSIEKTPGYLVSLPAPANLSMQAAISSAAHTVLAYLYPAQSTSLDAVRDTALALIPTGLDKVSGIAFGELIADAIIAIRQNDGWDRFVDHSPSSNPGAWQQSAPMFAEPLLPQWGQVKPFGVDNVEALQPAGPPDLSSFQWAAAFNEVKSLGAAFGSARTADQTQIARFWFDGSGTYTPPGHWNKIASAVANEQGLSLGENARLFAMLNVTLGDAAIVAWSTKYSTDFWRPITAIRSAETDGNSGTTADPNWSSLLINPAFPDYVSGHSTFSGAAAVVLANYFGDNTSFSSNSIGLPGVTRSFTSFKQAAEEAGQSRVYGGIHYQFSNQDGLATGRVVADEVLRKFSLADDVRPPELVFTGKQSKTSNINSTIQGWAIDNLSGVDSLTAQLDSGPITNVTMDSSGRFTFIPNLSLDGSADGNKIVHFRARDKAGIESADIRYLFNLDTRVPSINVTSPTANQSAAGVLSLTGIADGTGSAITRFTYSIDGTTITPANLPDANGAFEQFLNVAKLDIGPHVLQVQLRDSAGNVATKNIPFTLTQLAPFTISRTLPTNGSEEVGATYRPQVFFSRPVDAATLTTANFYATAPSGAKLAAKIVPASDGSFAWLYFDAPLPPSSNITLHILGDSILSKVGPTKLDANADGDAGGNQTITFSTVNLTPLPNTSLSGRVLDPGVDLKPSTFDDIRAGADGVLFTSDDAFLNPIAHAKVYILGLEDQFVYTDAQGNFSFASVPSNSVKLAVDGRTATNAPAGIFWPEMVMDLDIQVGRANTVMGTMGTLDQRRAHLSRTELYLPRLQSSILTAVSNSTITTVGVDAVSAPNLTALQRSQLTITVQPGSILGEDGQPLVNPQIGISTVPPELVRDMLPPGILQHTFDITIQAPGAATIAVPLQLTLPNTFNAVPGTKLSFLSFNHTTGRLEIDGTATVSEDGLSVTTDPENGVTHPGWHGLTPVGTPTDPPDNPNLVFAVDGVDVRPEVVPLGIRDYLFTDDSDKLEFGIENRALPIHPAIPTWIAANRKATPLVVTIKLVDNKTSNYQFLDGINKQEQFYVYPGEQRTLTLAPKPLLKPAAIHAAHSNGLYAQKIEISWHQLGKPNIASGSKTMYVYRLLDIADEFHDDGSIDFPRSLDRTSGLDLHGIGPEETNGTLSIARDPRPRGLRSRDDSGSFAVASKGAVILPNDGNRPIAGIRFKPPIDSGKNYALLNVTTPNNTVLSVNLEGVAAYRQKVSLDKPGLKAAIARLLDDPQPRGIFSRFQELFLDSDNDGQLTTGADQQTFDVEFEALYTSLKDTIERVYASASPNASSSSEVLQLLNFLDSDDVESDGVRWLDMKQSRMKAGTSLYLDQVPSHNGTFITGEVIEVSGAQIVKVNIQQGSKNKVQGAVFKVFGSNDGFVFQEVVSLSTTVSERIFTKNLFRFYRVDAQYEGVGQFLAKIYSYADVIEVRGSKIAPAAYAKVDYSTDAIKRAVDLLNKSSLPYAINSFIDGFNPSRTDRLEEFNASIKFFLAHQVNAGALPLGVTEMRQLGVLLGNIVAHELGHNLGVIHYSNSKDEYAPGDVMGEDGDEVVPARFNFMAPAVLNALGITVSDAEMKRIFKYYARWRLGIDSLPIPFENDDVSTLFQQRAPAPFSVLTPYSSDPNITEQPDWVIDHDFGIVSADGPGATLQSFTIFVTNEGGVPLNIQRMGLVDGGQGFSVTSTGSVTLPGAVVGGAAPYISMLPITITFDPRRSGHARDVLRIVSDGGGVETIDEIPLSGFGRQPVADLLANVPTNNFGGATLSGPAVNVSQFASIVNQGASPLIISSMRFAEGTEAFSLGAFANAISPTNPLVVAPGASFSIEASYLASKVGLERGVIEIISNDPDDSRRTIAVVGTGFAASGTALDYGQDYVARENPLQPRANVVRQKSDVAGNWTNFVNANTPYHIAIFDPISGLVAHMSGISAASGQRTQLGTPLFQASTEPDTDGDGLPDDIEFAIGTAPNNTDTDGDGLSDFAAIIVGQNPLAGNLLPVGVLSTLKLEGDVSNSAAVVVQAASNDPSRTILYMITRQKTLATVDVSNPIKPVVLKEFPLPALTLIDLAVDQASGIAVVITVPAAFQKDLLFVDIKDPSKPQLLGSVNFVSGDQVRLAHGSAFVFGNGELKTYDLATRELLQTTLEESGGRVAFEAGRMFVFGNGRLRIYDVGTGRPHMLSSTPQTGGFMSVGNGVVYLTQDPSGRAPGGYSTIDVSDPKNPRLMSGPDIPPGEFAPYTSPLALNGSGLALARRSASADVGGPFDTIDVLDVSDPQNTNAFVTRFDVPNPSSSISIAGGIAWLVSLDNYFGGTIIQALNFMATDTTGQAPSVTLAARVADADITLPGVQVVEESQFSVDLRAFDDVQVRSVELLVNGRVVETSKVFPFDLSVKTPFATVGPTVTIQARATDTGGSSALSELITLEVRADPTPLSIVAMDLNSGEAYDTTLREINLQFSKRLDPAFATSANYQLLDSKGKVVPVQVELIGQGRAVRVKFGELSANASYRFVIHAADVVDRAGRPLATADITKNFTIFDERTNTFIPRSQLPTDVFLWSEPRYWSKGRLPNESDHIQLGGPNNPVNVLLDMPGQPQQFKSMISYGALLFKTDVHVFGPVFAQNFSARGNPALRDSQTQRYPASVVIHGDLIAQSLTALYVNLDLNGAAIIAGDTSYEFANGSIAGDLHTNVFVDYKDVRMTFHGDVFAKGSFKQGPLSQIISTGRISASEFALYGGSDNVRGTFTGGTLVATSPTMIRTESVTTNDGYSPAILKDVTLQGDFEVVGGVLGGPVLKGVGFTVEGSLTIKGTVSGLTVFTVTTSVINGPGTLIDPRLSSIGSGLNSAWHGNLGLASNLRVRGGWNIEASYGGVIHSEASLTAEGPSRIRVFEDTPSTRFDNSGPIVVAAGGSLTIDSNQTGPGPNPFADYATTPSFISATTLTVQRGGELFFRFSTARLSRIDAAAGATVAFGGVLYGGAGASAETILSGPANWIAVRRPFVVRSFLNSRDWTGIFRNGAFTLQDGALLNGSALFRDATLNGDYAISSPSNVYLALLNQQLTEPRGLLALEGKFTLNGKLRIGNVAGTEPVIVDIKPGSAIDGQGEIRMGGHPDSAITSFAESQFGYFPGIEPVDIGPDIKLHAGVGQIGSIAIHGYVPPAGRDRGAPLRLRGKLIVDTVGLNSTLASAAIENQGQILVSNGARLNVRSSSLGDPTHPDWLTGGGTWSVAAGSAIVFSDAAIMAGGGIRRNSATLSLDGVDAKLLHPDGSNALQNLEKNTGVVRLSNGSQLRLNGKYTQTAGATELDGGVLSSSEVVLRGGTLTGTGVIEGSVTNYATLRLNKKSGAMRVTGDFAQSSLAQTNVTIAGATAGINFSQLKVDGKVRLDGALNIELTSAFVPVLGDRLPIVLFRTLADSRLTAIPSLQLGGGNSLVPFRSDNSIDLVVAAPNGSVSLTTPSSRHVRNEPKEVSLATLTDTLSLGSPSNYSAIVDWGDGTLSIERVTDDGGRLRVKAAHLYQDVGRYVLKVTAVSRDGRIAKAEGVADVMPQTLDVTLSTPALVQGVTYASAKLASFVDLDGAGPLASYSASVEWGNGTVTTGEIVTNRLGGFDVRGSYLYTESAILEFRVSVQRGGKSGLATGIRTVAAPSALIVSPKMPEVPVAERTEILVATFIDPDEKGAVDKYRATIVSEGGSDAFFNVPGIIRYNSAAAVFEVWQSVNYVVLGTFRVNTKITKTYGGTGSVDSFAVVAVPDRLEITSTFPSWKINTSYRNLWIASFTDLRGLQSASLYDATIDWGDGSTSASIIDTTSDSGRILVGDDHIYTQSGVFTQKIKLKRNGGPSVSLTRQFFVQGG